MKPEMFILQRYLSQALHFLQKPRQVRWQILFYTIVFSVYGRIRADYEKTYGQLMARGAEAGRARAPACVALRDSRQGGETARGLDDAIQNESLGWGHFPKYPIYLYVLRKLSTFWMCYILIRFSLGDQLVELARRHITNLSLPNHCYLLGRFIFPESVADLISAFFSLLFIINRFYMTVGPSTRSGLVYSLLIAGHDTELMHSRFQNTAADSDSRQLICAAQLGAHERFLLDTMCFRIHYPSRVAYKLRANRTAGAYTALCKCVARMSLVSLLAVVPVALALGAYDMRQYLLDSRYLYTYPDCDPELELMRGEGRLGPGTTITMTLNHALSIPFDILENCCIWIECGLIATIVPSIVHLINYDLVLHWAGIRRKIYQMESVVRREAEQDPRYLVGLSGAEAHARRARPPPAGWTKVQQTRDFNLRVELVAEINDFFVQVQHTSKFIAYILNYSIVGSLLYYSLMIYYLKSNSTQRVPWPLLAVSAVIVLGICVGSYSCMLVHNACRESYTRFCSLVANDPKKHKLSYATLIDHYREHRDCYRLMSLYPFLPSTLLTFAGWFISCFVIVSEVLGRSMRLAPVRE